MRLKGVGVLLAICFLRGLCLRCAPRRSGGGSGGRVGVRAPVTFFCVFGECDFTVLARLFSW